MRWSKLLKQYKFTIQYTSKKENEKTNVLNQKNDYMKKKKLINKNIFKINKNDSLSTSAQELNATFKILRDQKKQYFIKKKRLIILKKKINEIIKEYHDESLQKHLKISKILQLSRRHCRFSNMQRCVETYIRRCSSCQKNKHNIHKKYEKIQYQTSSKTSWKEVTMNFIMKLSLSINLTTNESYDSILVMINYLIKYFHIISFKETYSAEQLEYIVLNKLIKYYELSKKITSDKNKLFTFNYWKTLISLLNVKLFLRFELLFFIRQRNTLKRDWSSIKLFLWSEKRERRWWRQLIW
jgi:hypothetical protein